MWWNTFITNATIAVQAIWNNAFLKPIIMAAGSGGFSALVDAGFEGDFAHWRHTFVVGATAGIVGLYTKRPKDSGMPPPQSPPKAP